MTKKPEITIILPCKNEEKALPICLEQIKKTLKEHLIHAEIIVSDSSTDKSPEIAKNTKGVTLLKHNKNGYGIAYLEAFRIAKSENIFMADPDNTYNFTFIPIFLRELENYDLVIGNRFSKNMEKNSMPISHKYLGNPLLSGLIRILFNTKVRDSHCGMRAIKKQALEKLKLNSAGMEFASEMIIKANKHNLRIKEIPINYKKRIGKSKLKSIRDGLRHLNLMVKLFLKRK